jgi:hypothetical protein
VPELIHVAAAGLLSPGHRWSLKAPAGLNPVEEEMLRNFLDDSGAVSDWGAAMLASPAEPLVFTDRGLISRGLASVPGAPADRTLHVTEAGRRAMQDSTNRVIEMVFELVRNFSNPGAPSRLRSLFVYETIAQADDFIADRRTGPQEIWAISVPEDTPLHHGDGDWLGVYGSPLQFLGAAHFYWQGQLRPASAPHDREILVPLEAATVKALVKSVP